MVRLVVLGVSGMEYSPTPQKAEKLSPNRRVVSPVHLQVAGGCDTTRLVDRRKTPFFKEDSMPKKATKTAAKPAPKPVKITPSAKPRKKSELYTLIASHVGIAKKQVAGVFDTLTRIMTTDLAKPAPSKPKVFVLPGLLKVQAIHKPAQPERQGKNPFTGEMTTFKAKPARTVVKVRALKTLKSSV
jgi:nucleoid DNA-binding protein